MTEPDPPRRKRPDPRVLAVAGQRAHDAREFVRGYQGLVRRAVEAGWGRDPDKRKVLGLRRNADKPAREMLHGCILGCLLGQMRGVRFRVALVREQAHPADVFLFTGGERGLDHFTPVQLKELPPGYLNAETSLDALLADVAADPPMPDVSLAVFINRQMTFKGRIDALRRHADHAGASRALARHESMTPLRRPPMH